eukprot:7859268-Alexandrium_andersonii.AAC.1
MSPSARLGGIAHNGRGLARIARVSKRWRPAWVNWQRGEPSTRDTQAYPMSCNACATGDCASETGLVWSEPGRARHASIWDNNPESTSATLPAGQGMRGWKP